MEARMGGERFAAVVLRGVSGPRGVVHGFSGDPNVEPYLDAIDTYLAERASGRGRPSRSMLRALPPLLVIMPRDPSARGYSQGMLETDMAAGRRSALVAAPP
jgi:hypothetical protein